MLFGPQKWSSHKVEKNRHFAKELVHGFCHKINLFSYVFFFSKKGQRETFFDILDRKECHLDLKSEVLTKLKNIVILEGVSPWFLSKNRLFLCLFFNKKSQQEHFLIFWIGNKAFWTLKVKFSQSRKKSTFCKGVSPWFLSKNRPFSHFFFWPKKARKKHYLIFWIEKNRKECFLDHKREVLKNSKKSTFCKGVSPWFLSKNRPFSHFFFWPKKGKKKTFFDILDRKECFLDLKSEVLKNSKKIDILQRG